MSITQRIIFSLTIALIFVLLGTFLVGLELLPILSGLMIWLIGFALAVILFIQTESKSRRNPRNTPRRK